MPIIERSDFSIHALTDSAVIIHIREEKILVAADLHLGKSAAFRAHGLAVPEGDTRRDLKRLELLVRENRPDRLVIAGDMFHADSGCTGEIKKMVADFVAQLGVSFTLVSGNHDDKITSLPDTLGTVGQLDLGQILIVHKPEDASAGHFNVCGHIHPVLRIPDGRKTSLRLPCFHLRGNILTLPSFGSFTGGRIIDPEDGDRFYVTHMGSVIEVPEDLARRGG